MTGSDVQTDAVIEVTTNESIRRILFSFIYNLSSLLNFVPNKLCSINYGTISCLLVSFRIRVGTELNEIFDLRQLFVLSG